MIKVLIADDQEVIRAGLRALLSCQEDIRVVAEAANGTQAVERAREHRPHVILMDLRMPGGDGIEAARQMRADPGLRDTRVLILTTFDDEDDVLEAIRGGASGYLLKDAPADSLRAAIRAVASGESALSPGITRRLMDHIATSPDVATPHPRIGDLTERELAVMRRVAHGATNAEIARTLSISPATARTYVSRILAKLHARDRTELAVIAHRSGLYRDDRPD